MAEVPLSPSHRGPSIDRPVVYEFDTKYWSATSTRDQLVSAGVCTPAHFPIGRKRINYGRDSSDRWWHLSARRGGVWRFSIDRTREEKDDYRQAEKVRADLRDTLARMPANADEWRARKLLNVEVATEGIFYGLSQDSTNSGGYSLCERDNRTVKALLQRLWTVVANAGISFDPAARAAAITSLSTVAVGAELVAMPKTRAPLRLVAAS